MQLAQIEGSVFQEKFQREEKRLEEESQWSLAYLSMTRSEDNENASDARSSNSHDEGLSAGWPHNLTLLLWYHESIADTAFGS